MDTKLKPKETIRLLEGGTAYSTAEGERHAGADYVIASDKTNEDGTRVIVLAPHPLKDVSKKKGEVVGAILEGLGETKSRSMRLLLSDVFTDWLPEALTKLHERLVIKGDKVKAKEGCYKLVIGDGRRKDSQEIMLRD